MTLLISFTTSESGSTLHFLDIRIFKLIWGIFAGTTDFILRIINGRVKSLAET